MEIWAEEKHIEFVNAVYIKYSVNVGRAEITMVDGQVMNGMVAGSLQGDLAVKDKPGETVSSHIIFKFFVMDNLRDDNGMIIDINPFQIKKIKFLSEVDGFTYPN